MIAYDLTRPVGVREGAHECTRHKDCQVMEEVEREVNGFHWEESTEDEYTIVVREFHSSIAPHRSILDGEWDNLESMATGKDLAARQLIWKIRRVADILWQYDSMTDTPAVTMARKELTTAVKEYLS